MVLRLMAKGDEMLAELVLRKKKEAFKKFLDRWPSDDLEDLASSIGAEVVLYGDGEDDTGYLALEFEDESSYITYDDIHWILVDSEGNCIATETEVKQEAELEALKMKVLELENTVSRLSSKAQAYDLMQASAGAGQ